MLSHAQIQKVSVLGNGVLMNSMGGNTFYVVYVYQIILNITYHFNCQLQLHKAGKNFRNIDFLNSIKQK